KSQLDKVLPAGLESIISADHIEQVVEAFAAGIFKRYVFGSKGLFNDTDANVKDGGVDGKFPGGNRYVSVDIDGDGQYDGLDNDGDGEPDICLFGGTDSPEGPPCLGSSEALPPIASGGGGGGGNQCSPDGERYEGALRKALDETASAHPDLANLPNIEGNGGKINARTFLSAVAEQLKSDGYNATTDVLNGNNNPNTGDLIAVWKDGDTNPPVIERYDAMSGGNNGKTVYESSLTDFTGFIPLGCALGGGSKECGCKDNGGGGGGPPPPPEPPVGNGPKITSISPLTATAGVTLLNINGTDLTTTVQFFDINNNRTTVVGSLNTAKTQVSAVVPAELPLGYTSVKVYKSADSISNSLVFQITAKGGGGGGDVATVESVDATTGWGGTLAQNPNNNTWLVISSGTSGTVARVMGNDMQPVGAQFAIDSEQSGSGNVVFAPDLNKFFVAWIGWSHSGVDSAIYGQFINPDGTLYGNRITIHQDNWPAESSYFSPRALRYDDKNNKFVLAWEVRNPKVNVYFKTVSSTGTVGPLVKLTEGLSAPFAEDGRGSPSVAVNESGNEYCVYYSRGYSNGGWNSAMNLRTVSATTGVLGPETTLVSTNNDPLYIGGIVYNTVSRKYLATWSGSAGTKGRFMTSCNGATSGSSIVLNAASSANGLTYNGTSNTYAVIGQNGANSGNTYVILDNNGSPLLTGVAFAGGFGNFAPSIAASLSDGTFGATASKEYTNNRFVSNLKK
ncbi:hypothetical protein KW807_01510, partial [Candidatus Parcubacteria bacterium]|nr:hypothetical protein [Candidatus Parcubacteria bacterium]